MKNIVIIIYIVTATIYHTVAGQTDDTPDITASGFVINLERPMSHRIIAVSRNLEALGFKMGTKVCVTNAGKMNGVWTIEDRMNKRFTDRIDFLVNKKIKLGKWNDVKIKKIN
jgi:3D (Asp-Asp-Asp) domain-containing protein